MFVYLIFILAILGWCLIQDHGQVIFKKKLLLGVWGIIVLWWGSVDALDFGGDIMNYYNNSVGAGKMSYFEYLLHCPFERGYATWTWAVSKISGWPQTLLYLNYAFINAAFIYCIYKKSSDVTLSVFTYICIGGFMFYLTAQRQGIAMGFCLFAMLLAERKHLIAGVFLIVLATTIHQTCIIFLPLLFLYRIPISSKNLIAFCIICGIVVWFIAPLVSFANEQMDMMYGAQGAPSSIGGIINIIIVGMSALLLWTGYHNQYTLKIRDDINRMNNIVYLLLGGLVLYIMRINYHALERVSFYMWPIAIALLMPTVCMSFCGGKNKDYYIFRLIIIFAEVILVLFRFSHTFSPYKSIFF